MRVFIVPVLAFIVVSLLSEVVSATSKAKTPIEHVIVLMLENRSFDHYLGFLKSINPEYRGCLPGDAGCFNPRDPDDPNSEVFSVTSNAVNSEVDPSHSVEGTTGQIFSHTATPNVADMQGFIRSYSARASDTNASHIMDCFAPEHVPVMTTLAQEFLTFDGWFASVPGPTLPNRAYAAAASSHGMATCNVETVIKGLPNKTMFRQLEEMGLDWRVYYELIPAVLMFKDMRHKDARPRFKAMQHFFEDVANGNIPQYTFLEPNYYPLPERAADDQHPDHSVAYGEQLVKNVYEALRASPVWNTSALIITYDEHGNNFLSH
jgi:phospholipase C